MIYHEKQSNKLINLVSLSHDSSWQENNEYYHRKYVTTLYNSDSEALSCVHSPPALFIQKQNIDYQKKLKNIITYKIDWKYLCIFNSFPNHEVTFDMISWGFLKISQKKEKNQEILRIFSRFSLTNFQIKTLHHMLGHRIKLTSKKYQNYFNMDKSWNYN